MSEYESSRVLPVPPDTLFAALSDVERLPEWVPPADTADQTVAGTVHMSGGGGEHDARWRAEADQRRIEWSSAGSGEYAGWLQVYASGDADEASEAVIHLSFFDEDHQPPADVPASLERALDGIERLATR